MKRRIVGAFGALALAAVGVAAVAVPASATPPAHVSSVFIKSSPDDGCPVWARDSFTRTTKIAYVGDGKYKVSIGDKGSFVTTKGAASPGAPATPIANKVEGSIVGSGEFVVTGKLKSKSALHALPGFLDNSAFPCKADVPADRQTGNWAKRFFSEGATSTAILGWRWEYRTCAEKRVETEKGAEGNITGILCEPKVWLDKPSCKDRDAEINVKNVNAFEAIEVRFGAGPVRTVQPGKSTDFEFHAGAVQVFVGGVAFGKPFVYQPPRGCKPVMSWDVVVTAPTCAVNSTTVKVVNDGHVTFRAKLGDTSKYLKPGESISATFSAGKVLLWVNHKLVKSFEHKAAVCPPPVDNPNPPVDNPPAPGAGGGDAGGSDTSGDVPTLPQTGVLRSMWTTPTAFSAYGFLIVLVGAALFALNRRRKYVVEA